ncbi:aminoglycoside phosphotransferase family protein [Actinokineospora auranticolor]|uniref:Aminoglycoside phosphotransferase domain-containing protein n=1 Tax=Actinokineospora auranticolor TaxID=155976 RepID=A0A2S6GM38_9PSEU|nr:aminoglycoside phosphotransferase family protein [Actinokineospora auranticolor]PPK66211.1 hypothetical protein CLV40_111175 [Actinokineospora auranticolor]
MSTSSEPGALPGHRELREACAAFGLDATDARLLHHRSNAVYALPGPGAVARLSPDTALRLDRARTVITVTRWLTDQGHPVALAPLPGPQPVIVPGAVATFWPLRTAATTPTATDLAALLRELHAVPEPPFTLPRYRPLHRLREALDLDTGREHPVLPIAEHRWLTDRAGELIDAYQGADFPLGHGLVHADAHLENLVPTAAGWTLIDWDHACHGPRELDLLTAAPDHFHTPEPDRLAFSAAYGHTLTDWPHWTVLRDIAELHSLASYIRLAPGKPTAATELATRLRSLRTGDRATRWHAVS